MKEKKDIILLCANFALCISIVPLAHFFMSGWGVWFRVIFFAAAGAGAVASAVTFILKKTALLKSVFVLLILCAVFLVSFITLSAVGHLEQYDKDEDKINAVVEMLKSTGAWGMVIFFILQVLQVVILPLPAAVCYVPGALIWGPLVATLLASAGVICGSMICYLIGRLWGRKAVIWIAGREATDKYVTQFGSRGKTVFALMQILPFFPDDILCLIAGLTSMNFAFFTVSITVVRPLIIAAYCYLGSGTVIPFSGWGIWVWIAVFAGCIALAVLSLKYQSRFENWLISKFSRKSKNKKTETEKAENTESGDNN